jgi:hypothetical protein
MTVPGPVFAGEAPSMVVLPMVFRLAVFRLSRLTRTG